ncbi:hypothetical protein BMS3Abin03_00526 [bacterium BMS3Abin03]|nr:hypothetical protein BMS3Abin03_00526 [bacterium BMS3Abin03]
MGAALTLTFIKELLQFYNSPILFNYKGNVAVTGGLNNSLGRVIIFSINVDKIGGQLPAVGERMFENLPIAKVNNYVVLPKSDYTGYFEEKFNQDSWGAINKTQWEKDPFIYIHEGKPPDLKGIMVDFNKDLTIQRIDISGGFQVARDALVESGELQPPLSHTKEYINILLKQVMYWNGEQFVPAEIYEKLKAAR